tara:strand:- start:75 stop:383 length:309 start_codon:yes stop_codon:yes gene_type:complete
MKTFISTTEAIDQLYDMTDFSYKACEAIIEHYEGTDDEYMFDPIMLGATWSEKTAVEIMVDYDLTVAEFEDNIDYFYEIEGLRIGDEPTPCAYVFCKYFEQF